jgi:hypothetical protein
MNDSVALVFILSGVFVIYVIVNFVKSAMRRWHGGSRFTPEENAAYYRGLHRGRMEGMSGYFTPRIRYLGGRRVHSIDAEPDIDLVERPDDDPRYIDVDRTPRTYVPRKRLPRYEE